MRPGGHGGPETGGVVRWAGHFDSGRPVAQNEVVSPLQAKLRMASNDDGWRGWRLGAAAARHGGSQGHGFHVLSCDRRRVVPRCCDQRGTQPFLRQRRDLKQQATRKGGCGSAGLKPRTPNTPAVKRRCGSQRTRPQTARSLLLCGCSPERPTLLPSRVIVAAKGCGLGRRGHRRAATAQNAQRSCRPESLWRPKDAASDGEVTAVRLAPRRAASGGVVARHGCGQEPTQSS